MSHAEVNSKSLLTKAAETGNRELFEVLRKSDDYRVSAGVRLEKSRAKFFLEVLVYLCTPLSGIELARLEAKVRLIEELGTRGYLLNCEDGGCVSCEVTISPRRLLLEERSVMLMVNRIFGGVEAQANEQTQQGAWLGKVG